MQEYETVPCSVSCDELEWRAGDWSVCTSLTAAAAANDDRHCGPGHQSRSVRLSPPSSLLLRSQSRNTLLDQGSRSDRPRYHAHLRWSPPLSLASAATRRLPHRASMQMIVKTYRNYVTVETYYYYSRQSVLNLATNPNL